MPKKNIMRAHTLHGLGLLVLVALLALAITACQPAATEAPPEPPPPTSAPTEVPPPEPTPLPDQSEVVAAWESGPHAFNYDLGKGPNTYCSRCHSPQNWDPDSTTGPPPNCVTCKFAHEEEIRIATTMDFVEEADWVGITCETCHVMENGVALPGNAWLNVLTGEHEAANTPNEVCTKCHLTTKGIAVTGGSGVEHEIILGGSAHKNWAGESPQADRPQYCSDCHDPHSTTPNQCLDCHEGIPDSAEHMNGLNAVMLDKVDCMACHDSSGMEVGPHPDEDAGGVFTTLVSEMGRGGEMSTSYVKSHSIQWEVACDRCHFEENPWELSVLTASGDPPTEE